MYPEHVGKIYRVHKGPNKMADSLQPTKWHKIFIRKFGCSDLIFAPENTTDIDLALIQVMAFGWVGIT